MVQFIQTTNFVHYLIEIVGHHLLVEHFNCYLEVFVMTIDSCVHFSVLAQAEYPSFVVNNIVLPELFDALLSTALHSGEPFCTRFGPGHIEAV